MTETKEFLSALGFENVAVIGCGVIGRSWASVFARAGSNVRAYDVEAGAAAAIPGKIREDLLPLAMDPGEVDEIIHRIVPANSLEDAVKGAAWVQESVAEVAAFKRGLFVERDKAAPGATGRFGI